MSLSNEGLSHDQLILRPFMLSTIGLPDNFVILGGKSATNRFISNYAAFKIVVPGPYLLRWLFQNLYLQLGKVLLFSLTDMSMKVWLGAWPR